MNKTYAQIQKQIARLQREADSLREREVGDVISRIKEAIEFYELTPEQLFGSAPGKRGRKPGAKAAGAAKAGAKPRAKSPSKGRKLPVKFRDGAGNEWTGRGSRPRWLVAALAAGKKIEDFRV